MNPASLWTGMTIEMAGTSGIGASHMEHVGVLLLMNVHLAHAHSRACGAGDPHEQQLAEGAFGMLHFGHGHGGVCVGGGTIEGAVLEGDGPALSRIRCNESLVTSA